MSIAEICALTGALIGGGLGAGSLIFPRWGSKVTRLVPAPDHPEAFSEFRAGFGGLFLFLHLAVLATIIGGNGLIGASFAASAAWFGSGLGRLVSFAADKTATPYSWMNVGIELGLGLLLLAPFISHIGG